MDAFDIIGPIMVGPSSSHTAGACRIGKYARGILSEEPMNAVIKLSGSFKKTYKGHGTDKAIIAGLLGFNEDDERIRDSIEIAKKEGRSFSIVEEDIENTHANTTEIIMTRSNGEKVTIQGASIGGGNILITKINDAKVKINGLFDVLVAGHVDMPGMIYNISKILYEWKININGLSLHREEKSGNAIAVIEVDDKIDEKLCEEMTMVENVNYVTLLHSLK